MAYIQGSYYSKVLDQNIALNVIMPTPDSDEILNSRKFLFNENSMYQALYLLHSHGEDHTNWQRYTAIEQHVTVKHRIALVMPQLTDEVMLDIARDGALADYLLKEVKEYAEAVFPFSREKKDNYIAGKGVGGYCALRIAAKNPELFAGAAALSAPSDLPAFLEQADADAKKLLLGKAAECYEKSKADILPTAELVAKLKAAQENTPFDLYLSCGKEDPLLENQRAFAAQCSEAGVAVTAVETDGGHCWRTWDKNILAMLAAFPLVNELL